MDKIKLNQEFCSRFELRDETVESQRLRFIHGIDPEFLKVISDELKKVMIDRDEFIEEEYFKWIK